MTIHRPTLRSVQAPSAVVMIRPLFFSTSKDAGQSSSRSLIGEAQADIDFAEQAYVEISTAADELIRRGVDVHLFEDKSRETPHSVFLNNWLSTHAGGYITIYPMHAENRRKERREDVVDLLKAEYRVQDVVDYSELEEEQQFLEGTGAMVFDNVERVVYAVPSNHADRQALEQFCNHFKYEPVIFEAQDAEGNPVAHTNSILCIGTGVALLGSDMITDPAKKAEIITRLEQSGRQVVHLTNDQITACAGRAIELHSKTEGLLLAMSQGAYDSLKQEQVDLIEQSAKIVQLKLDTIEQAGGSARCAMAGIHLNQRETEIEAEKLVEAT
ncbi:citrulline utilization hydrolase CtlX [Pseudovibrio sp. FO-BEG1]|uniref:citrulline utilization hydrolase CtlX n=1 Tax=Pseudovibrio sp. (strain FO-BEG1) TaxID=911045 RepID=UPI001AD8B1F8